MVLSATSLTRSGVADFLLQRVSAIVMLIYTGCIAWFVLVHAKFDYAQWVAFMHSPTMSVLGTVTLFSWGTHAWIGMWTVGTDYLNEHHIGKFATALRLLYQTGTVGLIIVYFVFGIIVLW